MDLSFKIFTVGLCLYLCKVQDCYGQGKRFRSVNHPREPRVQPHEGYSYPEYKPQFPFPPPPPPNIPFTLERYLKHREYEMKFGDKLRQYAKYYASPNYTPPPVNAPNPNIEYEAEYAYNPHVYKSAPSNPPPAFPANHHAQPQPPTNPPAQQLPWQQPQTNPIPPEPHHLSHQFHNGHNRQNPWFNQPPGPPILNQQPLINRQQFPIPNLDPSMPSRHQSHLSHIKPPQNSHQWQYHQPPAESQPHLQPTAQSQPQHQFQRHIQHPQTNMHQLHANRYQHQPKMQQSHQNMQQPQSNMHQSQVNMYQPQANMHQSNPNMHQSQANMHQPQANMHQSQPNMHQSQPNMHQSQPNRHQSQPNRHQQPNDQQWNQQPYNPQELYQQTHFKDHQHQSNSPKSLSNLMSSQQNQFNQYQQLVGGPETQLEPRINSKPKPKVKPQPMDQQQRRNPQTQQNFPNHQQNQGFQPTKPQVRLPGVQDLKSVAHRHHPPPSHSLPLPSRHHSMQPIDHPIPGQQQFPMEPTFVGSLKPNNVAQRPPQVASPAASKASLEPPSQKSRIPSSIRDYIQTPRSNTKGLLLALQKYLLNLTKVQNEKKKPKKVVSAPERPVALAGLFNTKDTARAQTPVKAEPTVLETPLSLPNLRAAVIHSPAAQIQVPIQNRVELTSFATSPPMPLSEKVTLPSYFDAHAVQPQNTILPDTPAPIDFNVATNSDTSPSLIETTMSPF